MDDWSVLYRTTEGHFAAHEETFAFRDDAVMAVLHHSSLQYSTLVIEAWKAPRLLAILNAARPERSEVPLELAPFDEEDRFLVGLGP
jgi:hypothetical protein